MQGNMRTYVNAARDIMDGNSRAMSILTGSAEDMRRRSEQKNAEDARFQEKLRANSQVAAERLMRQGAIAPK